MARRADRRLSPTTRRTPARRRFSTLRVLAWVGAAVFVAAVMLLGVPRTTSGPGITVFHRPGCLCCARWAQALRDAGFAVTVTTQHVLQPLRSRLGVPRDLNSCHTAVTQEGYVIEGHVPVTEVVRLVRDRPAVHGLAVAGMPAGAIGMESPRPEAYVVWMLPLQGAPTVVARVVGESAP